MILCLETTTNVCSVALYGQGQTLFLREREDPGAHSSQLTQFIEEVLYAAGLPATELSAVAVSAGPGSYTGLRIGTATAKALCYALDIPLIAVPTLESLAWASRRAFPGQDLLHWPLLDARRMEVYQALYRHDGTALSEVAPLVLDDETITERVSAPGTVWCLSGDGAAKAYPLFPPQKAVLSGILCSAAHLGELAEQRLEAQLFESVAHFEPSYLKPPNINLPGRT
jgi:tRNA threonylcarbamoyladenosine biosynthesis protein TsaB